MTSSRPVPNLAVLRRTIPSWQAERTRLVRIDLESGDAETVSKNHPDAFGLAISADETTACVTERGSGSLVAIDLAKRTRRVVVSGLDCPGGCTWLDESQGLLAAIEEGSGALAIIDVYSGAVRRVPGIPGQPGMPAVVGDLLIVASGQVVVAVPAENVLPKQIVLVPPADAIYRGGYARVSVDMGSSGVSFDDVNFRIAEGNEFAAISPSRDGTFDTARPHTMLLAGPVAGVYTLEARDPSGALLAQASFAVTDRWTHTDGPPMAFTGANPLYATGGTWGALFNGVWPNVFTYGPGAVTGTRRVALIFVNTADTVLPGGTDMLYRNSLVNGVLCADGVMRSVRSYYREVSRGQLDIVLAGEATVTLPSAWGEYTQRDFTDPRYWPRDILMADAMRLAQGAIDFSLADIAVFVIASPNWGQPRWGGLPPQFIWPSAAGGTYLLGPRSGSWWWKSLPWTVMPAEWENVDPRRVYATLSHEIGHTIGLADLYHDSRAVGGWDLMSSDGGLPALSVPHRQFLGWIDPGWMRIYNFLVQNTVDEEVVLCAAELLSGGPPSGQHGGIVVEVAEGWRYYFEYRSRQNIEAGVDPGPPQVADQNPPSDRRVVGLDVLAKWYKPPLVRDPIRLLGDDGDFEGAALAPGQDYEELDASANSTFRLEVLSADDDQARVRVRYQPVPAPLPPGPNGPDPSIRPWPGGGNWSSPDIWIENALRINIPWANHTNTIFARVTNSGSMDAVGVRVGFWVKDMTVSDAGPETFLGWVTRDIRANASEEFIMAWVPPGQAVPGGIASAHFCLLVRIAQHSQGSPPRAEVNPNNNEAQSNYTMMWTVGSSPFSRERLPVTVANPYSDRAVEVRLHAEQTLDWFRTYLSHKSIWLSPGETRDVEVMVECVAGEPAYRDKVPRNVLYVKPNIVAVIAAVVDSNSDVTTPIGGATIEVRAARAAEFTEVDVNETGASGRIRLAADGSAPPLGGDVIVGTRATARGGEITYRTKLDPNGRFSVATPGLHALPGTEDLDFVYLGSGEVGPATAQVTFVSR